MGKDDEVAGLKGARRAGRSAVLPYRGSTEASLLPGFVPAVMQSGIDELVVGVDDDVCAYPEVADACELHGSRVRAVRIPTSPDWEFKFAAVLWRLIDSAEHDLVLVTNVDELPSGMALGKPERGRAGDYVLESGSDTTSSAAKILAWTGTFWLWRPAPESYFDLEEYKRIKDGAGLFFFYSAVRGVIHNGVL